MSHPMGPSLNSFPRSISGQDMDFLRERLTVELGGRDDDLKLPQLGLLTVSLTTSKIIV